MHETFRRPPAALAEAKGVVAGPVVTAAALEAMEAERQAKIEELEQMAEQMDELDESPDVPDSDMAD